MADTLQHGSITGNAAVRQKISGEVVIGGKIMKELRFLPYSEFPEIGREETLYIDTDNNAMYYYDGSAYVALSGGGGGGTDNYNALSNKPSVNSVTLIGNKTSSELGVQELISDLSTIRSGAASGSTAIQPEALETALSEKQDVIADLDDIRAGAGLGETAVQPSDMETALADKQDTISDLSTIRSGAASGSTAVQPSDMETALSSKQDVISDLSDIRSGASAGATAVQPSDMETALSGKQDTISDLQTIRSGASLGATAVQPVDMETALADKQDVIADLDTIRSGATAGNTALQPEDIDTLPTDGSSNPVSSGGTYDFVNSSIATNTAYFIGTFASVEELEAYTGTVTNNDYAFVTSTDSAGNTLYNRYKYNATTQEWGFEYAVNNTAFTAAQWAAIQSGITSADKTKLDGIETGANKTVIDAAPTSGSDNAVSSGGVHTALSGKQDTISDLSDIRSGASAGATAVQPSALNDYQTKLSGTNKLDPAYINYDASHRAVSDTEKSTWNGKQDTISDLSTIRSGAAAGATALQQSDVSSTYSASGTSPVNGTAVNAAIGTLDVSSVGGSGQYISAISETDGIIAATAETMDTVPTSGSTKAVTSGGIQAPLAEVVDAGAKNLLQVGFASKTSNTVTFTNNGDGSITINGNSSSSSSGIPIQDIVTGLSNVLNTRYTIPSGEYHITLFGGHDSDASLQIRAHNGVEDVSLYSGTDGDFVYDSVTKASYPYIVVRLYMKGSASFSNVTVKPLICTKAAWRVSHTYEPYAIPNPTLTPAAIKAVDEGAKNLLFFDDMTTGNRNGLDFVINSDGSISVSGTQTSLSSASYVVLRVDGTNVDPSSWCDGNHVLSGCPSGGSESKYYIRIAKGTTYIKDDYGSGVLLSQTSVTGLFMIVMIAANYTISGSLTFKPMICTAQDWAVSQKFVPYAPTNRELYEMIRALQNNS